MSRAMACRLRLALCWRRDDLDGDGIATGAEEVVDLEVLLDPFEEQLDLPTGLVETGDFGGRGNEIVAQHRDLAPGVDPHADQADGFGERVVALAGQPFGQPNDAIEQDA